MNQTQSYQSSTSHTSAQSDDLGLRGYTPIKKLGHGSQGDVFLARRDSDGIEVAIKRLNIESVKTWKTYELFHREAEVLSTLNIDGIAKFYEAVDMPEDDPPRAYIVQEFIQGTTLGAFIHQGHRFSLSCTFDIIVQLLTLIKQLHSHTPPIIHRDIKPSNVMLTPKNDGSYKVYLLDFGAVANPQLQGGGSTVAGTYGFMPPEQLMGKPIPASDVYAVAAVAVNLITGISPADMPVKDFHLIFEPQMQSMPVNVVNVLRQMLDPNIDKRLCDYDYLIDVFSSFRDGDYNPNVNDTPQSNTSNYNKQLKSVESYAQPGNIELWQQLPDQTPRPIPQIYENWISQAQCFVDEADAPIEELYFNTDSSIYQKYYTVKKEEYDKRYEIKRFEFHLITQYGGGDWVATGVTILLFVIPLFFTPFFKDSSIIDNIGPFIPFYFIFIGIFPFIFVFWLRYYLAKRASLRGYQLKQTTDDTDSIERLQRILSDGRKTIATIVDIQYDAVKDEFCEQNVHTKNFAVHQYPRFRVRYSFNPPDDRTPFDLTHEIIIDEDPESFLKVGDPLPILYRIYKNKAGVEFVNSIPFPIAIKNAHSITHLMGRSKCNEAAGSADDTEHADPVPETLHWE